MVSRVLCGDQCESREEDGEGREGICVSNVCGEGEAGQGSSRGRQTGKPGLGLGKQVSQG